MSGECAFGEDMHGFEEVARGLPTIGERDVKLEVRLGTTHGQPLHLQPGVLGQRQQRVGPCECGSVRVMHDHATGSFGLAHRPLGRHASERVATGPALWVERLDLELRGVARPAAEATRSAVLPRPTTGMSTALRASSQPWSMKEVTTMAS